MHVIGFSARLEYEEAHGVSTDTYQAHIRLVELLGSTRARVGYLTFDVADEYRVRSDDMIDLQFTHLEEWKEGANFTARALGVSVVGGIRQTFVLVYRKFKDGMPETGDRDLPGDMVEANQLLSIPESREKIRQAKELPILLKPRPSDKVFRAHANGLREFQDHSEALPIPSASARLWCGSIAKGRPLSTHSRLH